MAKKWSEELKKFSSKKEKMVNLAESINKFIKENSRLISIEKSKEDFLLEYDSCIGEEQTFPSITVANTSLKLSEANKLFNQITENFNFISKVISVNANPNSRIKTENNIFYLESDKEILIEMIYNEDSVSFQLNLNKPFFFNKPNLINESVNLFKEEDILIESIVKTNKYNSGFNGYVSMLSINNISCLHLLKTFHPNYVSVIEKRFSNINKKEFYTVYKNYFEHNMLLNHFISQHNSLNKDKDLKHMSFAFSPLLYKGKFYPLLVAVNNKVNRVIGVYCFVMKPKNKRGDYLIAKAELFRSPLEILNQDVLLLRKKFDCFYFG